MLPFAQYFKQQELSDADLVVRLRVVPTEDMSPPSKRLRLSSPAAGDEHLAKFPAHQLVIFTSDFFKVQVQNWQHNTTHISSRAGPSTRSISRTDREHHAPSAAQRPTLELTIDSAEQLPAAESVIASMYGVENALGSLQQAELVAAVMIADRVQVAVATQHAIQALLAAAKSAQGLSAAALDSLASLYPWPNCLLPLLPAIVAGARCCDGSAADLPAIQAADAGSRVQRMLVAVLGDLDAVWREQQLQEMLLQLPLPAMQLLLSSDQLRVASEDTVLYTATRYVDEVRPIVTRVSVKAALAPLVRCLHLSQFALTSVTLCTNLPQLLLSSCERQLRQLLALKHLVNPWELSTAELTKLVEAAPASWQLGQRQIVPLEDGVKVVWRLPVQQVEQACRDSFAQQKKQKLYGPESPPLGGLGWITFIKCEPKEGGGIMVGIYAGPKNAPEGVYYKYNCRFQVNCGTGRPPRSSKWKQSTMFGGHSDYFGLGPMAGGWDEAAWAAKGLPTTGDLELELHVLNVC